MSTRQKSFFDQNHNNEVSSRALYLLAPDAKLTCVFSQPRPHWQRTRSADNVSRTNAAPAKDVMSGPPIAPSSHTRSKLKAFQFIEGRPSGYHDEEHAEDKENAPDPDEDSTTVEEKHSAVRLPAQVPALVQSRTFPPSTPATRIPLADLIGNAEDVARRAGMLAISPDEQIVWLNARSPSGSRTPVRRPRKRAQSSSPVTSSQNETSYFFQANQDAGDVQNTNQASRTPQIDPAAELWSRYAVNTTTKDTAAAIQAPAFAHLIEDSSPHSSGTASSVNGLRRWASCGLDWPTSKAKRRKTNSSHNRQAAQNTFEPIDEDETVESEKPKKSKAGLLVERIQETLAKASQAEAPRRPSSSSPLPETGSFSDAPPASPLQHLTPIPEDGEDEIRRSGSRERSEIVAEDPATPGKSRQGSSSDFGSDGDIDIDMLEAIESASGTAVPTVELQPVQEQPAAVESHQTNEPDSFAEDLAGGEPAKQSIHGLNESFDEFGDDGDLFAADLENLASLYDTRPDLTPSKQSEPPSHIARQDESHMQPDAADVTTNYDQTVDLVSSEDEFGEDDIDVEQFAAAEAVATQTHRSEHPSTTSVGISDSLNLA